MGKLKSLYSYYFPINERIRLFKNKRIKFVVRIDSEDIEINILLIKKSLYLKGYRDFTVY